jgi:ribosome-associated protein
VILEVAELCSFADYFIICSGGSRRHVLALAEHVEAALKQEGVKPLGVEGLEEGQWVLLDYNTMVIHIFIQERREFYNLEDLWSEAPRHQVDTDANVLSTSAASTAPGSDVDSDSESISS